MAKKLVPALTNRYQQVFVITLSIFSVYDHSALLAMFFNSLIFARPPPGIAMRQPFECRLRAFLEEIEGAGQASNRQEALDLVLRVWIGVHEKYDTPESDLVLLRNLELCAEHGWKDLDKDPCYMDSPEDSGLRLHLHHDGTIVLQNHVGPSLGIVFSKPGAIALPAVA